MSDFFDLASGRFSVRKFAAREVEADKIQRIVEAGLRAPTACNNQPYRIWVARSDAAREKVLGAVPFPFVREAQAFIIVGANEQEGWVRKFDGKNFADIDAAIVATHIMLQIHDLGLGTTWIGHFDEKILKDSFEEMHGRGVFSLAFSVSETIAGEVGLLLYARQARGWKNKSGTNGAEATPSR